MSRVKIVDTVLRDGHPYLWATRMTTAMMLSVAETIDRIGFDKEFGKPPRLRHVFVRKGSFRASLSR